MEAEQILRKKKWPWKKVGQGKSKEAISARGKKSARRED